MPEFADPRKVAVTVFSWLDVQRQTDAGAGVPQWQAAEWDLARWTMMVHGIGPLLYKRLQNSPLWPSLPQPLQSHLAEHYRLNRERILALMQELCTLLQTAGAEDISLIPLKGSPLVFEYYEDPGLRPMADLDILARERDVPRLHELLLRLGYGIDEEHITPRHRSYALERYGRVPVSMDGEHPENPHVIEVHTAVNEHSWGIHYDITEDLWRDSHPAMFGDVQTLSPQPVALMQHLLVHESGRMLSGVSRLIALHDISLVSTRLQPDNWQQLLRAGQKRREERMLYAPLAMAARHFDCRVPNDVMDQLERGSPPSLVNFLRRIDAHQLSFCNPVTLSLKDRSHWYRSAGETLSGFSYELFPPPQSLVMRRRQFQWLKDYPLFVVYAFHVFRAITGQLRSVLRQPSRAWRRARPARQPRSQGDSTGSTGRSNGGVG